MRKLVLIAALLAPCGALADSGRYVAVLKVLSETGQIDRSPVKGTESGVPLDECELRRKAWLAKFGPGMDAMGKQLAKEGKEVSYSLTCEAKS